MKYLTILSLLVLLTAGCAPAGTPLPDPSQTLATAPANTPPEKPPSPGSTPSGDSADSADLARHYLSQVLGVPADSLEVLSVEGVEWPDASLGCPQPGMAYIQVLTPGFRVTLRAGSATYVAHTDMGRQAVVCTEQGAPPFPLILVTPGEIDDGQPWMPAY